MSGGHGEGGSKATGESRRVGPGVDMSRLCEGGCALLLGRLQLHKQPRDCPIPMPWDPWCRDRAHVLGCLQLSWAGLGRRQGRRQWTGGCQEKLTGPFCAGAEQPRV